MVLCRVELLYQSKTRAGVSTSLAVLQLRKPQKTGLPRFSNDRSFPCFPNEADIGQAALCCGYHCACSAMNMTCSGAASSSILKRQNVFFVDAIQHNQRRSTKKYKCIQKNRISRGFLSNEQPLIISGKCICVNLFKHTSTLSYN